MINSITRICMAGLGVLFMAAPLYAEDQMVLKTGTDRDSYSTGVDIVRTLQQRGGQIDLDLVIRGMKDGLTGDSMLMSEAELQKALAARQSEAMEKQKQAANQRDKTRAASADAGQNSEPAVPQKQAAPERGDDPVPSHAAFAKKEGQALKTVPAGQSGQIVPNKTVTSGKSVVELDRARIATKTRALEMRRKLIEQHRQQELAGGM